MQAARIRSIGKPEAGRGRSGTDPRAENDARIGDVRFRRLLREQDWAALPPEIRTRFSHRPGPGGSKLYAGYIIHTRMNFVGWLLSRLLKIIGAPLPLDQDNTGAAAVVTVTEDDTGNGQYWTRHYNRRRGFPQVIHSRKSFGGETGLEEHIGGGLGMSLDLKMLPSALSFVSERYFFKAFGRRVYLPRWLTPGRLEVQHIAFADGWFAFTLSLTHPLFGQLADQRAHFCDMTENEK